MEVENNGTYMPDSSRGQPMKKFTGRNREILKWLGEDLEEAEDPGFCLGCGEVECECESESKEGDEQY